MSKKLDDHKTDHAAKTAASEAAREDIPRAPSIQLSSVSFFIDPIGDLTIGKHIVSENEAKSLLAWMDEWYGETPGPPA